MKRSKCEDCSKTLSDEEAFYYSHRCEACETAHFHRIEAWRHGGTDVELDAFYSTPKPA